MAQSLLITVRFHEGRYHGRDDGHISSEAWPPSPARLFQALVAAAAGGSRLHPEARQALRWLEELDPPRIAAPAVRRGRPVKRFVPNNDLDSVGGDPMRVGEIRVPKLWRPCFFDADEPVIYVWNFRSGSEEASQVCAIAERLYQLGRGIDMAWASGEILEREEAEAVLESHSGRARKPCGLGAVAVPRSGTLESLILRHERKRRQFSTASIGRKPHVLFSKAPKAIFAYAGYDTPPHRFYFDLRADTGGFAPKALTSTALLVAVLRDAAVIRLQEHLTGNVTAIERLISGRGAGPADLAQRIRIIPIPSIGAAQTDPSIRRVMVEVPVDCPIRPDDLKWAFAGLKVCGSSPASPPIGLLVSTDDSSMADRFCQSGTLFRTITPAALPANPGRIHRDTGRDRAPHGREQAARSVTRALRHAGIDSRPTEISVQKEPYHRRGVMANECAPGSRFSKSVLWHVKISFAEPLGGPLLIGDGRFCGLGLLEPINSRTDVLAFDLSDNVCISISDRSELLSHLRRALMALARQNLGRVGSLFSGHEPDGRPDRSGHHAHIFLAADPALERNGDIARLIVAAPWAGDRQADVLRKRGHQFDQVTRQLKELTAGRLGRIGPLTVEQVVDGDPLIGPALEWIGQTPYLATRNHKKRDDPVEFIKSDLATECVRRGLPRPEEIEVLQVSVGPRGGRPSASVKLRFTVAVQGPLMLGRDSHMGGGLFHAA
ncbi:MAG: type I-U CRISPR-associated protein Csb2 [Chloroflexota bacterium]|nr:type I-U CRISPR-associated protein Csb2 [Chloroflexota bacterium]